MRVCCDEAQREITGKKALGPKWFVKPLPHLAAATFDAVRELVTRTIY
jgi:hypothetical protein